MTCDECFEAFSGAVDGEIASEEREAMNLHLDECTDCRHLQTRILALSTEMKVQSFPEPSPEQLKTLVEGALAGAQASRWGWLRQLVRAPYEQWGLRTGLRLAGFGGMSLVVVLSAVVRWLLPAYDGLETVAKRGLPNAQAWSAWAPPSVLLTWMPLLVLLLGIWTCGLPGLFLDIGNKARLAPRDVAFVALSLTLLGPVAALPLLAALEIGTYLLLCCLWTGLCLGAGFALVAFQTQRSLPRLALDFVALVLPLGALEWCARVSVQLPGAAECQSTIALLVGSLSFPTLLNGLLLLAFSSLLVWTGLAGLTPSYRSGGGRWLAGLLVLCGIGTLAYGITRGNSPWSVLSPLRAQMSDHHRGAYILASGEDNPWLLSRTEYPHLEVDVAGPSSDPRVARLRLAAAYLDWNESALLGALNDWADNAPGVTWGLSAFVDSLGQRNGAVITLPSEARQKTVAHLLVQLRWRVLSESVLSGERGAVRGRIEGLNGQQEGLRLRLIPVGGPRPLTTANQGLGKEVAWGHALASDDALDVDFSPPTERTVQTEASGEFHFARVPDGKYVLATLLEQKLELTYNSTIPGIFDVRDGRTTTLEPIILTAGREGDSMTLGPEQWQSQGTVEFATSADGPQAVLAEGANISTLVDSQIFHSGRARIKLLADDGPGATGVLQTKFFTKDGRLQQETSHDFSAISALEEALIDTQGRDGYLQVIVLSQKGRLTVKGVKLEVLSDG